MIIYYYICIKFLLSDDIFPLFIFINIIFHFKYHVVALYLLI